MKKINLFFIIFVVLFTASCSSTSKMHQNDFNKDLIDTNKSAEKKEKPSLTDISISSVPVVKMSNDIKDSLSTSEKVDIFDEYSNFTTDILFDDFKNNILSSISNPINENELIEKTLSHPQFLNYIAKSTFMLLNSSFVSYEYNDEFIKGAGVNYISSLDKHKLYFSSEDVDFFTKGGENILSIKKSLEGEDMQWMLDVYDFYHQAKIERFNYLDEKIKYDKGVEFFSNIPLAKWSLKINDWPSYDDKNKRWHYAIYDDYINILSSNTSHERAVEIIYEAHKNNTQLPQSIYVLESFLDSFAKYIDPHSSYLAPTSKNNFQSRLKNFVTGIGVVWESRKNDIFVKQVIINSPAYKDNNIKVGYKLKEIGSSKDSLKNIVDMSIAQIREMINNYPQIHLVLEDDKNETFKTTVSKSQIQTNSNRVSAKNINISSPSTGKNYNALVITIPVFYKTESRSSSDSVSEDIKSIILNQQLSPPDLIFLDLRNNGGGVMSEAVLVASLFLQDKNIMAIKTPDASNIYPSISHEVIWSGPLAVLVNNRSASASEIVAGALQDYNRAIILGEKTYGKGTAQMLFDFDFWTQMPSSVYGQLNLTNMMFFRPSGESTQLKGISPDVYIALTSGDSTLHGEATFKNPIQHQSLPPLYMSTPPYQGPSPWQLKIKELQQFADDRWQNSSWYETWLDIKNISNETNERVLSFDNRKKIKDFQREKQNELQEILSASNDIILKEALAVAQKAFDGVNYQYHIVIKESSNENKK